MKTKMLQNKGFSCFQTLGCCIYHANTRKQLKGKSASEILNSGIIVKSFTHEVNLPLKRQSQLQQTTNFATSFLVFDRNNV